MVREAPTQTAVVAFSILLAAVALLIPSPGWAFENRVGPAKRIIRLDSGWQFREVGKDQWHPASVPGCVMTDLFSNRLIEEPFLRDNADKLNWVGQTYWIYQTAIQATPDLLAYQNIELVFKGLDTYARIYLNGVQMASTDNMFREWRLSCAKLLRPGPNVLEVHFASATNRVLPSLRHLAHPLPAPSDPGDKTSPYTRKAPYQYGWDWAPRLLNAGIWKPAFLEAWDKVRIADLQVFQEDVSPELAHLKAEVELASTTASRVHVSVKDLANNLALFGGDISLKPGPNRMTLRGAVPNPRIWWPNGLGTQALYSLEAHVSVDGKVVDRRSTRIGIRKVELRQRPDAWGKSFEFVVNDVPVFAKGGNWVPADVFPQRVTLERYRAMIGACRAANMNMLRVWGGGLYESDEFYDLCDEMGILVWQDFVFANALYPASESFLENVRREASDNVRRLRNHPSLALWCGNNEVETGWFDWGWKKRFPASFWDDYKRLFHGLLPGVCRVLDPGRPYWPSSPSSNLEDKANSRSTGDVHYWDVWLDSRPFKAFEAILPRFMSEYGFQSFPSVKTMAWFSGGQDLHPQGNVMAAHQKGNRGTERIHRAVGQVYGKPLNTDSGVYLSQLAQAEAIRIAAEHLRRNMPRSMGSLYWQINDCWPAISWSGIDYFGRWKALHYYARRFYQDLIISAYEKNGQIKVAVVSDRRQEIVAALTAQLMSFDGRTLFESRKEIKLQPLKSETLWAFPKADLLQGRNSRQVFLNCDLRIEGERVSSNRIFFDGFASLELPRPTIEVETRRSDGKLRVQVSSDKFAKDVELSLGSRGGFFGDNYFDLLPGMLVSVDFEPEESMTPEELKSELRVRSLADAVAPNPN